MSEAKEKDQILAQIKALKHHGEIVGLERHLVSLKADNLLDVWYNEQRQPISIRLSDKGESFIKDGGYAAQRNRKIKAIALKFAKWFLVTVIGAALVLLTNLIISRWLSQ